jgi:hypothetical protein
MNSNRGQTLHLFAFLAPVLLAFVGGFVIDGGLYLTHIRRLQEDLDAACLAAAQGVRYGDVYTAFSESLAENGVSPDYFQPYTEDERGFVRKGIQWGPFDTLLTGLQGTHRLYFGGFFGWEEMPVTVRSRCRYPLTRLLPVAMQEPWYLDSREHGTHYPILGQGVDAAIYSGRDYRGAISPSILCAEATCTTMSVYEPLEADPPADSTIKDVWEGIVKLEYGSPYIYADSYIPILSGTSNKFLVDAVRATGVSIGDELAILVFERGEIFDAEHGWETVKIIGYALVEVTNMDRNTIEAVVTSDGPLITEPEDLFERIRPRTVPWDWFRLGE